MLEITFTQYKYFDEGIYKDLNVIGSKGIQELSLHNGDESIAVIPWNPIGNEEIDVCLEYGDWASGCMTTSEFAFSTMDDALVNFIGSEVFLNRSDILFNWVFRLNIQYSHIVITTF